MKKVVLFIFSFLLSLGLLKLVSTNSKVENTAKAQIDQNMDQVVQSVSAINRELDKINNEVKVESDEDFASEDELLTSLKSRDPHQLTEDGSSELMLAIDQECTSCFDYLLEQNVDVNVVSKNGQTALSSAVIAGNPYLVQKLLDRGAKVFAFNNQINYNLIMHAATTGQNVVLKMLLRAADQGQVNAQDANGMSALMYAAREGFVETAKILLEANSNKELVNSAGQKAKDLAIQYQHKELIDLL